MLQPLGDILSFLRREAGSAFPNRLARFLLSENVAALLEELYGGSIEILGRGIFSEEKGLWKPLMIAAMLKDRGVLKNLKPSSVYSDEPQLFGYTGESELILEDGNIIVRGHGASSENRNIALWRCLGEIVERFSFFGSKVVQPRFCSLREIGGDALDPRKISGFSEKQRADKGIGQIGTESKFGWVRGYCWTTGKKIWIPAQLISPGYKLADNEVLIRPITTTGTAAFYGGTIERAIIRGILEILERDAFIISWLNKFPLKSIDLNDIADERIQKLYENIRRYRLEIRILIMKTDIPLPAVLCIIFDPSERFGGLALGAKVDFDWPTAILHAMEEAVRVRRYLKKVAQKHTDDLKSGLYPSVPTNIEERAWFWMRPGIRAKANFYFSGEKAPASLYDTHRFKEAKKEKELLPALVKFLAEYGLEVNTVDITHPHLAGSQWHVMRVIIPQAAPLWLNEDYPLYGCPRIFSGVTADEASAKEEGDLNTFPHPFL